MTVKEGVAGLVTEPILPTLDRILEVTGGCVGAGGDGVGAGGDGEGVMGDGVRAGGEVPSAGLVPGRSGG